MDAFYGQGQGHAHITLSGFAETYSGRYHYVRFIQNAWAAPIESLNLGGILAQT